MEPSYSVHIMVGNQCNYQATKLHLIDSGRGVIPSYIDAYTCAKDLLIGGLFTLQKN